MEIGVSIFNLQNVVVVVPDVATIVSALAEDPTLVTMAGPYIDGELSTKGTKTRKICPVPYS